MKKLLALAALGLLAFTPATVKAEDAAAPATTEAAAPAAEAAATVEVKEVTLKDGTKVSVEGESVFVVGADGAKTPAPDGEHELADGTKLTTKDGKAVTAPAAEEHKDGAH